MNATKPSLETCLALIRAAKTDTEKLRAKVSALNHYTLAEITDALKKKGAA